MNGLEAYIWSCGDDECDCWQPVIEMVRPNPKNDNFITREHVWRGKFYSQPTHKEYRGQINQLKKAAKKYGIKLNETPYGFKELPHAS